MNQPLRWGILGAGRIAAAFAGDLPKSNGGTLAAVASRSLDKAKAFAAEHAPDAVALGSYDELVHRADVDAVYVATPHPQHAESAIKLLRAGKHVLCEKPLAPNAATAEAIVEAAHESGRVLMEAYMYRCHPLTAKLVELLRDKVVGDVQVIDAAFSFRAGDDPKSRLLDPDLAGGGILDVGGYAMSIARLVAGVAGGGTTAEPKAIKAVGHLGPTGVDEWTVASCEFPGGVLASLRTGVRLNADNGLRVYGTEGKLTIDQPYLPARHGGTATIRVERKGEEPRDVTVETTTPLYGIEAETFAKAVADGGLSFPAMTLDDTLDNLRALDLWRREIKLAYPFESAQGLSKATASGEPLRRGERALTMPAAPVPGLAMSLSRLVMGVDNQNLVADAAPLWDQYFEDGGNGFDTATVYGKDKNAALGQWIAARGVRDEVAVICKGAHTPMNQPDAIAMQLDYQFDWLGMDHCDLYFLHRDNPEIPAGEFVDVLNEQADAGRIRGPFGGSNWTLARVREANEYAKANGKRGFTVMSQNFSLAEMVEAIWKGCESAHDDAWIAYLADNGIANFAWSSQARGFFVPDRDLGEPELQRCWISDANLRRRERCFELAERKNVAPVSIAAAWVLKQPFLSFALVGPRRLSEWRTTRDALGVELTDAEHAWLDLKADSPA